MTDKPTKRDYWNMALLKLWKEGNMTEEAVLKSIGISDEKKRNRYIKKLFHLLKQGEANAKNVFKREEELTKN